MHSQTSSSSESSRSGSPDTRATTPPSILENSYLPQNYVYLASTAILIPTLCTLFDKYTSSARMGLIIDHSPNPTFPTQGDWVKKSLPSQPALEYSVSSAYLAPISSVCQLEPILLKNSLFSFTRLTFPFLLTLFKQISTAFSPSLAYVRFSRYLWPSLVPSMFSKSHLSCTCLFHAPSAVALLLLRKAHLAIFRPSRNGEYCGHHGISSLFR